MRCMCSVRIVKLDVQDRLASVESLSVHLEDQQNIVFDPDNPDRALEAASRTKLTAFFHTNAIYPQSRDIFFCNFPGF